LGDHLVWQAERATQAAGDDLTFVASDVEGVVEVVGSAVRASLRRYEAA